MNIYKIITLGLLVLAPIVAQSKDKKNTKVEVKPLSRYEKLFKDKKVITKKGIVTLHKIENKVYFELPLKLLNREMIMATTIEEVSNIGDAFVGQQPRDPLYIQFVKNDTIISIANGENYSVTDDPKSNINRAIKKNSIPAIMQSFSILAYNKDSSAVVFDATPFLLADNRITRPFDPSGYNSMMGFNQRTTDYKSNRSCLGDISSFSDNFSITSYLSYGVTSVFFGMAVIEEDRPYTALAKRSFMLLPEKLYKPRISDPRLGVFTVSYDRFSEKENGIGNNFYVTRWRLEPSDTTKYNQGVLVEPIKPIIFYIDDKFPSKWIGYIKKGVEQWNSAFEKIGFKNAIQAKVFPKDDPEFDPNNIKYSCIRYAPLMVENAMGPSWIDPRTGEILSASVYLYHNIASLITMWRFIQTSPADQEARTANMPESIMAESLKYIVSHEVGHCLGLMHNMAGSASIPVDSLRSVTFTNKYGTTSSIMDYARFNHVAQPGDKEKGVKLTPPDLGVYDYYAIKWLYTPLMSAKRAEDEVPFLDKMISEKMGDPMYRYGKQQVYSSYDPTSMSEDLGDDAIKATKYGIMNLKYILKNSNNWLDKEDLNYEFRSYMYNQLIFQLYKYINQVSSYIGGIYINEKKVGDTYAHFVSVPKEKQREAMLTLLDIMEDMSWLDDENQKGQIELMGSISDYCQMTFMPILFIKLRDMPLSASLSENPYKKETALKDILDYTFRYTKKGINPPSGNLKLQDVVVTSLIAESNILVTKPNPKGINSKDGAIFDKVFAKNISSAFFTPEDISGFDFLRKIPKKSDQIDHICYGYLMEARDIISKEVKSKDKVLSAHYSLLLIKIDKALKIK